MSMTRVLLKWAAVAVVLIIAACPGETAPGTEEELEARRDARSSRTLEIVHPDWSSEIASAHLVAAVLRERLGYRVELTGVDIEEMWRRVADREADILLGAWLPVTHREYFNEYSERLDDLGANLTGARIGLVVPTAVPGLQTEDTGRTGRTLVTTESIPQLAADAERFRGRIVGIESGAGVVQRSIEALERYGLDRDFRVVQSNEAQMVRELSDAVRRREWVVITGWSPHWMFEVYPLRFLDDPENVFGGEESIHTMVREGLASDEPDAYAVLDRITYEPRDLERLMWWIYQDESGDAYGQALRWIGVNSATVDRWVDGVE